MITIYFCAWAESCWSVAASVTIGGNNYSGSYTLDLPESAGQSEIEAAVLALYAPS